MTTIPATPMMPDIKNLSFAKVAASASKGAAHKARIAVPLPAAMGERGSGAGSRSPLANPAQTIEGTTAKTQEESMASSPAAPAVVRSEPSPESKVVQGLNHLKLDMRPPSVIVNESGSSSTDRSSKAGNSQTPSSDDVSQKADSGSELGTKPPSLDGKSITSGTTFNVLDEKESLRPDDSASMKAAADEDDTFSVRGSLLANSRMGSDVAGRLRAIQIGDMPPRVVVAPVLPEAHVQGIVTPESATSGQLPVSNGDIKLASGPASTEAFSNFYSQNPDEKLLEAMKSPKDRIFLLRLEKDVIEFVQDSKEPFMDLPPSNSFCRLLTHKLADYYHMTHSFEAVAGAVRIYRTPFCRVPPSLGSIAAANESASNTPPPALLPKTIMRRGMDGDSAPVSAGPSKPTSEAGSELKEKAAPAKEKLTREEREDAYNKARLRIFGCTSNTEASTPENEDSTGVSRASSVSAKDRSNLGKRVKTAKQRRDDSESFDSRSQYTAFWGHPHQMTWAPQSFMAVSGSNGPQFPAQMQQQPSFPNAMGAPAYPPNQPFPPAVPNGGYGPPPQLSGMANFPSTAPAQPASAARFPAPTAQHLPAYGPPMPGTPQQQWQTPTFTNPIPIPSPRAPPPSSGGSVPYPYGQLPVHGNSRDLKSQHPIPGSYNRQGFNPKTQSFIPGVGMPPMPAGPPVPQPGLFPGPPQQQPGSISLATAPPLHMPYNGYQSTPPPPPMMPQPPYGANGGGYGMMRQGSSNNSMPPYHHGPPVAAMPAHAPSHPQHQQPQTGGIPTDIHGHHHQLPHQHHTPQSGPHCGPPHHVQQHAHHHHNSPRMLPNKPVVASGGTISAQGGHSGAAPSHTAGTAFGNLPNYGNPATLPQKPSTT